MHTARDTHLRLGVRKQNWLRLEHLHRVRAAQVLLWRALFRSLQREESLSTRQRIWVRRQQLALPRMAVVTKHNTRCRVSGRTRQAFREVQLARMQFRQHVMEGRLGGYHLSRR